MFAVGRVGLHCKAREHGSIAFLAARLAVSVICRRRPLATMRAASDGASGPDPTEQ